MSARNWRVIAAPVVAGAVLLATAVAAPRHVGASAAAGTRDPDAWARACSAGSLGLGEDTVARAPVLAGDKAPDGRPVRNSAAGDGSWYPIVLVHGWTSQDTVANPHDRSGAFSHLIDLSNDPAFKPHVTRSLLGQLQGLPGAAVFTFDYHPYSARWVDDEHLGPALGKVIDCLYQQSGQKVVLVGHSMGGLITRWAATHPGVTGVDRSAEISTVVTFGTPETGSVAALLAEVAVDSAAVSYPEIAVIRLVLSVCGALSSNEIQTGTVCDTLPPPLRTFESSAGIALRYGSAQLAALKPWPKGIYVDALAGDTSFETPQAGWFHWPWKTDKITGPGDVIVTKGSALYGADNTKPSNCDYQLNPIRGATDSLGLLVGWTAASQVAQQPLGSFSGACFHTSLMRNIALTGEALGAINDDVAARAPTTTANLAPVDAHGTVAPGWSMVDAPTSAGPIDCQYTTPSPSAVTDNIYFCSPTADVADACWPGPAPTMLCLQDPFSSQVTAMNAVGPVAPVHAPSKPDPIGLELADGDHCRLRIGGAWDRPRQHPDYTGWYSCKQHQAIWAPSGARGINTSSPTWTVIVGNANGPLTTERVTKAYYVATHADLPQAAASGRWTDRQLTITPTSLGAVKVGMPFDQAQRAAGITFNSGGDGYTDYGRTNPAYPQLWIGGGNLGTVGSPGSPVRCVGAGGTPTAQAVVTPEGFHLGDSIQTLISVYGSRATYVPAPAQGGMTDNAGYIVSEPTGNLVFILDNTRHHVSAIAGGPSNLGPNGCTG